MGMDILGNIATDESEGVECTGMEVKASVRCW